MFRMGYQMEFVTPIQALTEIKPYLSNLSEFGCTAFFNIPSPFRTEDIEKRSGAPEISPDPDV